MPSISRSPRHVSDGQRAIVEWLLSRAVARKDPRAASRWAVEAFRITPSVDAWKKVRAHCDEKTARSLLRAHAADCTLLIDLHLVDGDVEAARKAWKKLGGSRLWRGGPLAEALAPGYPKEAASIWEADVDELVKRGDRSNYRTAAGILRRAVETLRKARHRDVAAELLAAAREQHKGRPAFLDELARLQS